MVKTFFKLLRESHRTWVEDRASMMSGSLAYFELLSLAPTLAVVAFAATKFRADNKILNVLNSMFPPKYLEVVKFLLLRENKLNNYDVPTLTIITLAGLYLSISYFATLKDSIEIIWGERLEKTGLKNRIIKKWEDFKFTIGTLIIIFIFVMLRSYIHISDDDADTSKEDLIFTLLRYLFQFISFFFLLLYILKFAPPVHVKWRQILPGALLASALQGVGRTYVYHYLQGTKVSENTAEIMIVLLLWFYYSNLLFLFCAEYTKAYIKYKGRIASKI